MLQYWGGYQNLYFCTDNGCNQTRIIRQIIQYRITAARSKIVNFEVLGGCWCVEGKFKIVFIFKIKFVGVFQRNNRYWPQIIGVKAAQNPNIHGRSYLISRNIIRLNSHFIAIQFAGRKVNGVFTQDVAVQTRFGVMTFPITRPTSC